MSVVRLRGWKAHHHERRVELAHLLQQHCSLGLASAFELMNRFVGDGELRLEFTGASEAAAFAAAADLIGLMCELGEG